MSKYVAFSVTRGGNTINSDGVACQLDNISIVVIAASGGAIPNNSFECITLSAVYDTQGKPVIQQGDQLIDLATLEEYRASGTHEPFDDHLEIMIVKVVGT
jgi:hypothetical protein